MFSFLVTYIAALAILVHCLFTLNSMPRQGHWLRRAAGVMMCVGTFWFVVHPFVRGEPDLDWPIAMTMAGQALNVMSRHWEEMRERRALRWPMRA